MKKLSKFDHWRRVQNNFDRIERRYAQGAVSREVYRFIYARLRKATEEAIEEVFGGEE